MGAPDIKELFEIHTWPWLGGRLGGRLSRRLGGRLSRRLSHQLSRRFSRRLGGRLGGRLRFRAAAYFFLLPSPTGEPIRASFSTGRAGFSFFDALGSFLFPTGIACKKIINDWWMIYVLFSKVLLKTLKTLFILEGLELIRLLA